MATHKHTRLQVSERLRPRLWRTKVYLDGTPFCSSHIYIDLWTVEEMFVYVLYWLGEHHDETDFTFKYFIRQDFIHKIRECASNVLRVSSWDCRCTREKMWLRVRGERSREGKALKHMFLHPFELSLSDLNSSCPSYQSCPSFFLPSFYHFLKIFSWKLWPFGLFYLNLEIELINYINNVTCLSRPRRRHVFDINIVRT